MSFRHEKVNRRFEAKQEKHPIKNQPEPLIFSIELKWLYPKDRTAHYIVNPNRKFSLEELQRLAEHLGELYGMNVTVFESFFNRFEVYLEKPVPWFVVEQHTKKALEID